MPPKPRSRTLPKDKNPLLQQADEHQSLVRKCKVQEVLFETFSVHVIRLKLPVPASPDSESIGGQRFITRMNDTDYFQALSMFEIAYPFATEKEKDAEKAFIEKNYPVVQDAKVKGLWVTSDVALKLARDYDLEAYIRAMKDASPDRPSESLTVSASGKAASAPTSPNLPPEVPKRSRRSVSPKKGRVPKATAPKAPSSTTGRGRKKKGSTVDDESVASSSPNVPHAIVVKADEAIDKGVEDKPVLDTIEVGENDSSELLAAAEAQVAAAKAEEASAPATTRVKRALETDEEPPAEQNPVKRARVGDPEREAWVDGRRGRALLGLAIGLGASVVLPYLI